MNIFTAIMFGLGLMIAIVFIQASVTAWRRPDERVGVFGLKRKWSMGIGVPLTVLFYVFLALAIWFFWGRV